MKGSHLLLIGSAGLAAGLGARAVFKPDVRNVAVALSTVYAMAITWALLPEESEQIDATQRLIASGASLQPTAALTEVPSVPTQIPHNAALVIAPEPSPPLPPKPVQLVDPALIQAMQGVPLRRMRPW